MAGLVPAIHDLWPRREESKTWITGTSPVMTVCLLRFPAREPFPAVPVVGALRNQKGGSHMSDTYIIEVGSQAAGIVVRNPEGFRFFASSHRFNSMEGQLFRNAREAERAAFRSLSGRVAQTAA
jgi:hypothetical protein